MSRYIDIDDVANAIYHHFPSVRTMADARGIIEEAPSIDLVRCKECRYWIGETEHYEDREYKACWQLCGQYMNSEFWCKYGEREGE